MPLKTWAAAAKSRKIRLLKWGIELPICCLSLRHTKTFLFLKYKKDYVQ